MVVSHQLGLTDVQETCLQYIVNCKTMVDKLAGYDTVPQEVSVLMFKALHNAFVQPN